MLKNNIEFLFHSSYNELNLQFWKELILLMSCKLTLILHLVELCITQVNGRGGAVPYCRTYGAVHHFYVQRFQRGIEFGKGMIGKRLAKEMKG